MFVSNLKNDYWTFTKYNLIREKEVVTTVLYIESQHASAGTILWVCVWILIQTSHRTSLLSDEDNIQ